MKKGIILLITTFYCLLFFSKTSAQGMKQTESPKIYPKIMIDNVLLQSSLFEKNNTTKLSTLRLSYILNVGYHLHKDLNPHLGIYTGLHVKNLGFIEKIQDSTIKRRVYALGIPLIIKLGNMKNGYLSAGGGLDIPFHFKEKGFRKRNSKTKTNEWISRRTQALMPYVMLGYKFKTGTQFKLSFYPQNFLNTQFMENVNQSPYADYYVRLLLFSWSVNIGDGQSKKPIIPTKAPPLPNIL